MSTFFNIEILIYLQKHNRGGTPGIRYYQCGGPKPQNDGIREGICPGLPRINLRVDQALCRSPAPDIHN